MTLTLTSALAFMVAIALKCFYAWDEPTAIAMVVAWGISAFFLVICTSALWEGKSLCDGVRVLLSKITASKVQIVDGTINGASSSNEVPEVQTFKIEVVVKA